MQTWLLLISIKSSQQQLRYKLSDSLTHFIGSSRSTVSGDSDGPSQIHRFVQRAVVARRPLIGED